jgi:hypothetical protein
MEGGGGGVKCGHASSTVFGGSSRCGVKGRR